MSIKIIDGIAYLFTFDQEKKIEYRQDIYKKYLIELLHKPMSCIDGVVVIQSEKLIDIANSARYNCNNTEISILQKDYEYLKKLYF